MATGTDASVPIRRPMPLTSTTTLLPSVDRPLVGQRRHVGQRGVVRLLRGIDEQHQLAAVGEERLQRVDLAGQEIDLRPRDHDDGGVIRHAALLGERQAFDLVVVTRQLFGDLAVARPLRAGRVLLAVTLREVDLALLAGDDLDDGVGQILLRRADDPLDLVLVFDGDRAVGLDLLLAREGRFLVGIHILDRHLLRRVRVFVQPIPVRPEAVLLGEDRHLERCVQALEHLHRLRRQRELAGGGQVPALVLARRDVVERRQDRENHEYGRHRNRAEARRPPGEQPGHLAPLAERVQQDADQAAPRQPARVRLPLRLDEEDGDRGQHEHGPQPPDRVECSFQHRAIPATARCPPPWPSGTARR